MRAESAQDAAYHAFGPTRGMIWWVQAGLKSSAYRLAHLSLPKSVLLPALAAVFFLA